MYDRTVQYVLEHEKICLPSYPLTPIKEHRALKVTISRTTFPTPQ